jgi:hypothetical protein
MGYASVNPGFTTVAGKISSLSTNRSSPCLVVDGSRQETCLIMVTFLCGDVRKEKSIGTAM